MCRTMPRMRAPVRAPLHLQSGRIASRQRENMKQKPSGTLREEDWVLGSHWIDQDRHQWGAFHAAPRGHASASSLLCCGMLTRREIPLSTCVSRPLSKSAQHYESAALWSVAVFPVHATNEAQTGGWEARQNGSSRLKHREGALHSLPSCGPPNTGPDSGKFAVVLSVMPPLKRCNRRGVRFSQVRRRSLQRRAGSASTLSADH